MLDEADRMLDQGFERDIRQIVGETHKGRQTALFSATWPDSVRELAHSFLNRPIKVTIGSEDLAAGTRITQIVEVVEDRAREGMLINLLNKYHSSRKNRVLIFVLYKKEAARVEMNLKRSGWKVIEFNYCSTLASSISAGVQHSRRQKPGGENSGSRGVQIWTSESLILRTRMMSFKRCRCLSRPTLQRGASTSLGSTMSSTTPSPSPSRIMCTELAGLAEQGGRAPRTPFSRSGAFPRNFQISRVFSCIQTPAFLDL